MNTAEIIAALRAEETDLETQCRGAQVRIAQLRAARAALEGRAPRPERNGHAGPTVRAALEAAARELGPEKTFDKNRLAGLAAQKFPEFAEKIQRGKHAGTDQLLHAKTFLRVPGGFQLAP